MNSSKFSGDPMVSQTLVIVAVPPSDPVKCTRPARGKNGRGMSSIAIMVLAHNSSRRLTRTLQRSGVIGGDINQREIKEALKIPALRKPDEGEIKLLGRRKPAQRS